MNQLIHVSRRRGFSFTEVLFAVVILGVGFIMVAGIFPVAIQQSKLTIDETTGASIARGAINYIPSAMSDINQIAVPPTAQQTASNCRPAQEATPFRAIVQQVGVNTPDIPTTGNNPPLARGLQGSQILPEDPRYGFVTLFSRPGADITDPRAASAQLFVFAVQSTIKSIYEPQYDGKFPTGGLNAINSENNLMAHSVRVAIRHKITALGDIDLILFDTGTATNALQLFNAGGGPSNPHPGVGAAVEGGYVVIARDHLITSSGIPTAAPDVGRMNGRVYKIGAARPDLVVSDYFPTSLFSTVTTGYLFELDSSAGFTTDAGGDGVPRLYSGTGTSVDDVIGLGNSGSGANGKLSIDLPTAYGSATTGSITMDTKADQTAEAFVVGRSFVTPDLQSNGYEGNSMVVGLYTTFAKLK